MNDVKPGYTWYCENLLKNSFMKLYRSLRLVRVLAIKLFDLDNSSSQIIVLFNKYKSQWKSTIN